MNNLGNKIMKLRKSQALSQEELGEQLNVTRQTVSKWELGETTPEINKLKEMAKIFNVSVDELLEENESINTFNDKVEKPQGNTRNTIIIIALAVILVIIVAGLVGSIFIKTTNNKADGFFKTFFNIFEKNNETVSEIQNKALNRLSEIHNNVQDSINNNDAFIDEIKNNVKDAIDNNESFEKSSFNSKYENLYTGLESKFFTETAIKYVISDNLKNERKITVVYNDTVAKESKELTSLISKLNKKEYLISYEYDEDGYINKMIIEDV